MVGIMMFDQEGGCVYENQPVDPIGRVCGQVGGDKATHRVADDAGTRDVELIHPGANIARYFVEDQRVPPLAGAKADQIDDIDAEALRQIYDVVPPPAAGTGKTVK